MIWRRKAFGQTIEANGAKITPESEAIGIDTPYGGLVWNRPVAILVESNAVVERKPIVDITRVALWFLRALTFVFSVNLVTSFLRRRTDIDE